MKHLTALSLYLIRMGITCISMLLSLGYTYILQVTQDCSRGNIDGSILLIISMGLATWYSVGQAQKEMRCKND